VSGGRGERTADGVLQPHPGETAVDVEIGTGDEPGAHRRIAAPTSSSGLPKRFIGVWLMIVAVRSGERIFRFCSAGKNPGQRTLTRTPFGASSRATFWV
jgi:hypothetical protein